MAAIVLAQLATTYLAPAIYGTIAAGATIESAAGLWALSQGLSGFAGSMLGSAIDNALFGSAAQSAQGPRLSDLTVQASTDGAPLPRLFGTHRLAGNVVWSTGLEEVTHVEEVGGGSGGGGTITTYTYQTDVAIALCEGQITGIRRIWADTKLIYDVSDSADADTLIASSEHAAAIRVYTGSETQEPDPLIQAIEGTGNAPAFRGTAYVVFEDLRLADFGNRVPNFTFEVVRDGASAWAMAALALPRDFATGVACGYFWSMAFQRQDADGLEWVAEQACDTPADATIFTVRKFLPGQTGDTVISGHRVTGTGRLLQTVMRGTLARDGLMLHNTFGTLRLTQTSGAYTISPISASFADVFADDGETLYVLATDTDRVYALDSDLAEAASIALPGNADTAMGMQVVGDELYVLWRDTGNLNWLTVYNLALTTATTHNLRDDFTLGWVCPSGNLYALIGGSAMLNRSTDLGGSWEALFSLSGLAGGVSISDFLQVYEPAEQLLAVAGRHNPSGASQDEYPICTWWTYGLSLGSESLQTVCEALADRAGIASTQYDFSALASDIVRGYVVARPMTTRAALEPLMTAYLFDLMEEDGKIKAVKRGGAVDANLTDDDLGAAEQSDGTRLDVTRHNPAELPSDIAITYADQANDYQPATQYARRLTATKENVSAVSLPMVLTSQEAARLADILLNVAWHNGRHALSWACTYEQARLSPTDIVSLPGYGATWQARVTQADLGAPGLALFQGVPDLPALYSSYAVGADAVNLSQSLGLAGPSNLRLLDCVMLRDEDNAAGWYVAGAGYLSAWPGAVVFKSNDGGATWGAAAKIARTAAATMGYATSALGAADCRVWDKRGSVTVRLTSGALASTTAANLLNGGNAALLGAPGRWELLQFQTAALNADGTYTIRDLLRGRKGTDHAAGSHAVYDTFILLSATALQEIDLASSEIGASRQYKTVTAGRALEEVGASTSIYAGERLECLSPVLLGGGRDASGNLTLTWVRRDRVNAGWNNNGDVPMSEATQAYEVDIYSDATYATVKRTLTGLSGPTASYTSAQQVADFGANQTTVYVRVYQLSASVGRGHFLQGSV